MPIHNITKLAAFANGGIIAANGGPTPTGGKGTIRIKNCTFYQDGSGSAALSYFGNVGSLDISAYSLSNSIVFNGQATTIGLGAVAASI